MKVLIAEDLESVQSALRLAVESLGHEVVGTAGNGEEVLLQYDQTKPDVVLMDVMMPAMDGLTCSLMLVEEHPAAKVLIVTGQNTSEDEARLFGARGCLYKPFGIADLDQGLRAVSVA